MNLSQKKCVSCEGGVQPMEQREADQLLKQVPGWSLAQKAITRTIKFEDFKEAMDFVNRVARIAELEGHHPDIAIRWNTVTLTLTTHAIKGLSENDFIMAAKINGIVKQP
jgi:4a-hydroxytetrahydrobiopterin dehydratase